MQPSKEDFAEWQKHPVTEWIIEMMRKAGEQQQSMWSSKAWSEGLDPTLYQEAKIRADCYEDIPNSTYEDWVQVDDTEIK